MCLNLHNTVGTSVLHDQMYVQINRMLKEENKVWMCSNTKARQECLEVAPVSVTLDPINSLHTVVASNCLYLVSVLTKST